MCRVAARRELKDHLRAAGDVQFVRVHPDGSAIARFYNEDDMLNAVAIMNGSLFRSSRITVVEEVRAAEASGWCRIRPAPTTR